MEHNLYDNDTDDYYDDDSDTLIMDLSDICDKSNDSEEENEPFRVSNCIEMKNYAHEYCHCALYTYVCNINNGLNCIFFL